MLDFVRLDAGQLLVGAALYYDHTLYPLVAGNAVVMLDGGRAQLGLRCASPVHVITYPANSDVEQPSSAVLH